MHQIKFKTKVRDIKERWGRSDWIRQRVPSDEYYVATPSSLEEDGYDIDDEVETTITIWSEDADKVITEFWFKFP